MSRGIKIVLAVLAVGFVLVVGSIAYVYHRVKVAVASQPGLSAMAGAFSAGSSGRNGVHSDDCRFLTKAEVSAAIGIPVVEAHSDSNGCHYLAHGTVDSLASKHTAITMKDSPQMVAGILQGKPDAAADAASPELTSVIDIEVWEHGGLSQFNLESTTLAGRKPGAPPTPGLEGIGDDAFRIGTDTIIAHKGDMFIDITYSNCPCSTEQVAPLAVTLSKAL